MKKPPLTTISKIFLLGLSLVALTGFGCRQSSTPQDAPSNVSIVVWGLWQDSEMMDPIVAAYKQQTGVNVEYKKHASVATYERALLEAFAEGRGPDIFVIHHTWTESKRSLITPAPVDVINERQLRDEFVGVVAEDSIRDGQIWSLPTSVDTLALFYNEDLLAAAGIARPPATWQEFQQAVERLTVVTRLGIVEQSAAAIGTAENVNRAPDILQMLMLQSGIPVATRGQGSAPTTSIVNDVGERALTFYLDYSNKSKKVFTWDLQQDFSLDAFAEGDVAMMMNYSYHIPTVRAKNPRLRFAIAPAPQIADSTPRTFANYWSFAVSSQSKSPQTAWHFLRFLTSKDQAAALNAAQMAPPARRDSIEVSRSDPFLGVFADQSLVAVTWPRIDVVATDAIFSTMIDSVVKGAATIDEALGRAEDQLNELGKVRS